MEKVTYNLNMKPREYLPKITSQLQQLELFKELTNAKFAEEKDDDSKQATASSV